jgi:hypothetical protein
MEYQMRKSDQVLNGHEREQPFGHTPVVFIDGKSSLLTEM